MPVWRWAVVLADLGEPVGSEQGGRRPVLVVSNEDWNQTMRNLTVLPMTTSKRKLYAGEMVLPAIAGGQPEESIVMAHQIRTISKHRVLKQYGHVADAQFQEQVIEAILDHLDVNRDIDRRAEWR